jgi:protein-L-isoaspartate(D-aspartate) O-methyltransferase
MVYVETRRCQLPHCATRRRRAKAQSMSTPNSAALRQTMVDTQLKTVGVTDAAVLAAFAATPREPFLAGLAHADAAHEVAPGRHLLAPLALALLLQHAAVQAGERVLVVGSASGYSAAVLARMGAQVTALESDAALIAMAEAAGVASVSGPLAEGWAAAAPYDLILFEGAIAVVPPALAAQLAPGGRIAAVLRQAGVGRGYAGPLNAAQSGNARPAGLPFIEMAAPDLPGFAQAREFAF